MSTIKKKSPDIAALRRAIARIEDKPVTWFHENAEDRAGTEPGGRADTERHADPADCGTQDDFPISGTKTPGISGALLSPLRAEKADEDLLSLGEDAVDGAFGGGFPGRGLAEVHGEEARDAGCLAGFAIALAARLKASAGRPVLWIADRPAFQEAGLPYPSGLADFQVAAGALTCVLTRRLEDAVWTAEEAAACKALALVVLEVRGNPKLLGLEGTRRLHLRGRATGVPLLLLRQSGRAEATAAPLRVRVGAHPARPVADLSHRSRLIGAPVFRLAIEKNRLAPPRRIDLVWSSHERSFHLAPSRSGEPVPRFVHAEASHRSDPAGPMGAELAFRRTG